MQTIQMTKESGPEKISSTLLSELLHSVGTEDIHELKRWAQTGKLLEKLLKSRGVAIMGTVSITRLKYKCVDFPMHEWMMRGGMVNYDFEYPLEALQKIGKS